ncbi:MAG: KEOPS complex subunit Cgi121 [Halopenitus sp.]
MISLDSPTATPDADVRLVEGVADVDDLDEFLATVDEIRSETGAVVQLFDARYVVSREHLTRAVALAERAAGRDETVARDRAVEVLLYAAGRRQIDRALEMGVSEGEVPAVAVAYAPASDADATTDVDAAADRVADLLTPAETLDDLDRGRVMDFFDVTEAELTATTGTLTDVVLERVALLDVEK